MDPREPNPDLAIALLCHSNRLSPRSSPAEAKVAFPRHLDGCAGRSRGIQASRIDTRNTRFLDSARNDLGAVRVWRCRAKSFPHSRGRQIPPRKGSGAPCRRGRRWVVRVAYANCTLLRLPDSTSTPVTVRSGSEKTSMVSVLGVVIDESLLLIRRDERCRVAERFPHCNVGVK